MFDTVDAQDAPAMVPPRLVSTARVSRHGLRVIICGGREFENWPGMWAWLDRFDTSEHIGHVATGGQFKRLPDDSMRGADYWGKSWAMARGRPHVEYKAEWRKHGRAAGPMRNQRILDDERPDVVIAFPGGSGTADMVRRAREAGVRVIEVSARDLST